MTEIAFHFGAPDRLRYACRLLRKIAGTGAKATVLVEPGTFALLEQGLWGVGPTDFVPHASEAAAPVVVNRSPIFLTTDLNPPAAQQREVLVNLRPDMPADYARFARLIEVVSAQGDDRESARSKWRQYTAAGHSIVRHDLQLKESAA